MSKGQNYNKLLIALPNAILRVSREGTLEDFIPAAGKIPSFSFGEISGMEIGTVLPQEISSPLSYFVILALDTHRSQRFSCQVEIENHQKNLESLIVPCSENRTLAIIRDMTNRKHKDEALLESEERFKALSDSSPIGIYQTDTDGRCIYINKRLLDITGLTEEESLGFGWFNSIHPKEKAAELSKIFYARNQLSMYKSEFRIRRPDGEVRWLNVRSTTMQTEDGRILGRVGTAIDITEEKQAQQVLEHLATHDTLTNLPNRNLFYDIVTHAIMLAKREMKIVVVMLLDLDDFKAINDKFGHVMADRVLQEVSVKLKKSVRESDTVARLAGDEFTIALENISNPEDALKIAEKILMNLSESFILNRQKFSINASIGISLYPKDGQDIESLIKAADAAMYAVKKTSKKGIRLFSSDQ
jgi:diguanylate cyclase (GGDEF)-like protein/PAS domain S-box-containing protein